VHSEGKEVEKKAKGKGHEGFQSKEREEIEVEAVI
jgi:hypothetical protein